MRWARATSAASRARSSRAATARAARATRRRRPAPPRPPPPRARNRRIRAGRLEAAARLLQEFDFLGRGRPAQHRVAMREAAEARDDGVVAPRPLAEAA